MGGSAECRMYGAIKTDHLRLVAECGRCAVCGPRRKGGFISDADEGNWPIRGRGWHARRCRIADSDIRLFSQQDLIVG
jgi:hypothetical protein